MIDDGSLLRAYVRDSSDAAFAELVHRHLDLVYSAALVRLGGNDHRAREVTQRVFVALADKAPVLLKRRTLAGWLYIGARHSAAELMRSEQRRERREYDAQIMQEANDAPTHDWSKLKPLIERGLGGLKNEDRDVLLVRFFEARSFSEIGATLRLNEDAARRRCDRALERLRSALSRQGITSTASALGLALSAEAAATAPVGLASSIISAALSTQLVGTSVTAGSAILSFMSTTKATLGTTAAMVALIAASWFHHVAVETETAQAVDAAESSYAAARKRTIQEIAQHLKPATNQPATPPRVVPTTPTYVAAPPELAAAHRRREYAFWNQEFEQFLAERRMTPDQIAQFDATLSPNPQLKTFRDGSGHWGFMMVQQDTSHQDENLRNLLGPENYEAMKAFQRNKAANDLAAAAAANALLAGTPMESNQLKQLASVISQNDEGRVGRMGGTPNAYAWSVIVERAQNFLNTDQLAALNAIQTQISYRIGLANDMYPDFRVTKEAP